MTTALIIFLSGTLGAIAGYALGIKIGADRALHFGKWTILSFKGVLDKDKYYFIAKHNKADLTAILDKNGDAKVMFNETDNAK